MNVDQILSDLRTDEGFRSRPYDDATGRELAAGAMLVGKLTIGIGRNLDDVSLSESEAEFMCRNDIEKAALGLDRLVPEWRHFPDPVQRGLVNMAFNMGQTRLAGFQNMLTALRKGDWETAAHEALTSKWAAQVGDRAKRIAQLFRSAS